MFKIIANSETGGVVEIVADFLDDVQDLPTDVSSGSTAIVLEDSSVYMLGNDEEQHPL